MDVNKLPVWVCVLLVAVMLISVWVLLNVQFGGMSVRLG
jgi:hypothetical protein